MPPNWFRLSVGAWTSLFCCTFRDLLFSVTMLAFSLPLTDFTGNLLILVLWAEEAEAAAAAAAAASAAWHIDEIVVREGASAADRMPLVVFVRNDDGDVVEDTAAWWLLTRSSSSSSLWCVSFVTYKHGVDLGTFILFVFNAAVAVRWWDWEWFVVLVFVVFVLLSILERFLYISVRFSPKLLAFIVALAHFSSGSVLSIIWSSLILK